MEKGKRGRKPAKWTTNEKRGDLETREKACVLHEE